MSLFHALLFTLATLNAGDVTTTVACPQPCTETNPTVPNPAMHPRLFVLEEAGSTIAEGFALARLHRRHPTLATVLTVSLSTIESSLIASNLHSWHVVGR